MARELHVYSNDHETIVAESIDDAVVIWAEYTGYECLTLEDTHLELVESDKVIPIWCNAKGEPDEPEAEGVLVLRRTAAEWARQRGRGLLCCVDT